MLLRSSISSTKKFFQKTIKNFKTLFSPGYERLPKTPPHNHSPYSVVAASGAVMDMNNGNNTSYQELDNYYKTEFNENWDSEKANNRRIKNKKSALLQSPTTMQEKNNNDGYDENKNKKKGLTKNRRGGRQRDSSLNSIAMKMREHRYYIVEQKLRELEMLDMSNVDYVLDIEEVLHYYSRLTCPAYLEIVDRFFMEMYSEFFGNAWNHAASPLSVNSRMKLRYHHHQ